MRTCNSDTTRPCCVEPSETNEGGPHTERICTRGKNSLLWKSHVKQEGARAEEGMKDEAPNSGINVSGCAHRQRGW